MALKLIKNKIKSTGRTSKVTKAMEAVSAVKMRKSQERALSGRPYAEAALRVLTRITKTTNLNQQALPKESATKHDCIIVVTSDKGLAGSLNSAVLKEAHTYIDRHEMKNLELICFGRKSYEHFTHRGNTIAKHYINVTDDIHIDEMDEVVDFVIKKFESGTYKTVGLVYQNFVSTFEQNALYREILPLNIKTLESMVESIVPKEGAYSHVERQQVAIQYSVEPQETVVYNTLFPMLIRSMLYHALLESKASEHSARMVAMKNATDKAREMTRSLTLLYNKERQSVITAEVSEITGGIEAMSKK